MKKNDIIEYTHAILASYITKNDMIVDATMGNGYDTVYLATIAKHVYAFDIQRAALDHTIKLCESQHIDNVTLFHTSHEHIVGLVKNFKGVVFNLGYLPQGDHTVTTKKDITLSTIKMILSVLKPQGFICLVVYPGHPEGMAESKAIDAYMSTLDTSIYTVLKSHMPYQKNNPPYVLFIKKQ